MTADANWTSVCSGPRDPQSPQVSTLQWLKYPQMTNVRTTSGCRLLGQHFSGSCFRWLFEKNNSPVLTVQHVLQTRSSMAVYKYQVPVIKYKIRSIPFSNSKSLNASFILWFQTHTMHSYYIVHLALRQNTVHLLGEEGAVGIPKHYTIERKHWSKNTFWIYTVHYVNKHSG